MLRRRFHSSGIHPSNAGDGVYGVAKNLKLLPSNKVDAECIGAALIHKGHRIMIEKNESKNPSYKQATEGMLASDNFVWGEYLVDQYEIPNYDTIDYDYQGLTSAYLMSNSGVYNGQPHIPNDISQWTGVMSDWNGKSNSEVLKKIGATEQGSYAISGNLLNGFINSSDALGFDDWYIPSCPQMSLIYMRMVDINDILYLIGGKVFQASTEAYMTSSECNDRNYWAVSGFGQVGVSDKRNSKRIRLIRDL